MPIVAAMNTFWRRLAAFYRTQVQLWDRYGQRYDLSGLETRAALCKVAPLHWSGGELRGSVLPPTA